jgi:hypothetical protein
LFSSQATSQSTVGPPVPSRWQIFYFFIFIFIFSVAGDLAKRHEARLRPTGKNKNKNNTFLFFIFVLQA